MATLSTAVIEELPLDRSGGGTRPPKHPGRIIILTSGTTGSARGAARPGGAGLVGSAALLERIPFRARDTVVVAAPLFHSWGLATAALALSLSCTVVLQSQFSAEATIRAVSRHQASVLVVVPLMLQRILDLGGERLVAFDTQPLRVIASSGSALGPLLVRRTMGRFGPVLYNAYGSTEVSAAAIATPEQLLAEPSTAGSPAFATTVVVLGDDGTAVPAGTTGEIFVANELHFEGYTDGGTCESRHGLLASGDVGHFDPEGRLFVDGRADDMIVSGGENVYPAEIEEVLATHPTIAEAHTRGVPDPEFGQRIQAFVVLRPGQTPTADDLKDHVRERLARYKVPRDIVFVDSLPRTATGKVIRRELR